MALNSDGLILREEIFSPLTTKGAELTFEDVDGNFVKIYEDLRALSGSGSLPEWEETTTYSLNVVVSYNGLIWKYVNAAPSDGVVPGSDPLFWVQLVPSELAHAQNTDLKLAEGTSDEVSAAEIRAFIDSPTAGTNIFNNDGTISAAVERVINMNGKIVRFDNGQFVVGDALGSSYLMEVNGAGETKRGIYVTSSGLVAVRGEDTTGTALNGVTNSGLAVYGLANAVGIAVHGNAITAGSISGWFVGRSLIEETSTAVFESSAIHEVKSTVKGSIPAPKMTTANKNAIPSPATALTVFDTNRSRFEFFNGSSFRGMSTSFTNIQFINFSPVNGQTVAFGNAPNAPTVATNVWFEMIMRGNGIIVGCDFNMLVGGVLGTSESWSLYVRHNGTDYLVQTVGSTAVVRKFNNTLLNIPYVDGDIVRMILVNPTWVTAPTSVTGSGFLIHR